MKLYHRKTSFLPCPSVLAVLAILASNSSTGGGFVQAQGANLGTKPQNLLRSAAGPPASESGPRSSSGLFDGSTNEAGSHGGTLGSLVEEDETADGAEDGGTGQALAGTLRRTSNVVENESMEADRPTVGVKEMVDVKDGDGHGLEATSGVELDQTVGKRGSRLDEGRKDTGSGASLGAVVETTKTGSNPGGGQAGHHETTQLELPKSQFKKKTQDLSDAVDALNSGDGAWLADGNSNAFFQVRFMGSVICVNVPNTQLTTHFFPNVSDIAADS